MTPDRSAATALAAALLLSCLAATPAAAPPAAGLGEAELAAATRYVSAALAGPAEEAFLQILTGVEVVRDEVLDSVAVYDVVVRYDPRRYRSRLVGRYPLTFESQFVRWGKRIGLLTRSATWRTGRYYLHDISTGRQAWAYAREARELYPGLETKFPPAVNLGRPASQAPWLQLIYQAGGETDLRRAGRWLRLLREEPREQVQARRRSGFAAAADSIGGEP